jgi:WD40 repeat protein
MRTDILGTTTSRSTNIRHHPIIRTPQTRCDADQTVFKIHKGVKTFDLCTAKNVLVTGGMDRVIRLWNPYLPSRPVARLRGHNAPVFLVKIAVEDNRLFSISSDKTVLVSFLYNNSLFVFFSKKNNHQFYKKKNQIILIDFSSRTSSF